MNALSLFGLFGLSLVAIGCAAQPSDADPSEDTQAFTAGQPSRRLSQELFGDADPHEPVDYVLVGNLPSSGEACSVTIARRGLNPPRNSWSSVTVHPFGPSQSTVEAHGPVNVPFATPPEASHDRESIQTNGETIVYSRAGGTADSNTKLDLTLTFATGKVRRFDTLVRADIAGTTVVGHQEASCEHVKTAILLRPSEYTPVANAARATWEKEHGENLEDLGVELEGCRLSAPAEVTCAFGNDSNEETLGIVFELNNGAIGRVLHAERHSS